MTSSKRKTKPKGTKYVVKVDGAYWEGDDPVAAGTELTLTKAAAAKLLDRGIIEEA